METEQLLEELLEELDTYTEAREELREAKKTCDYDQDYFLSREINRVKESRERMGDKLDQIIDARITSRLAALGQAPS